MRRIQTPSDFTIADRIARGKNQKRWLEEMVTSAGLNPNHGANRAHFRRIETLVDNLAMAGYATQMLLIGPRFNFRVVITGYVPAAAPLLAAIRANTSMFMSADSQTVSHCELLAWVEHAKPDVVSMATTLAPHFSGSLEDLLALAPGVAQDPVLSSPSG